MSRCRHVGARAFTLVEAAITVAILALAVGVVLASFGVGRANLRKIAGMLSGTIRATYDNACLTGQTHRLVFSFDKPVIRVEATEQLLSFDENQNPLVRGARTQAAAPGLDFAAMAMTASERDDELDEMEAQGPPSVLQAMLGLAKEGEEGAQASFQNAGHDLPLGDDVHLLDIWVQGMDKPATEGEVYLTFFSQGFTQDAVIHLEAEQDIFTVKVHALTGKTEVLPEFVEAPK